MSPTFALIPLELPLQAVQGLVEVGLQGNRPQVMGHQRVEMEVDSQASLVRLLTMLEQEALVQEEE